MKILPDSVPDTSATPEDFREEVENFVVIHALLANLIDLNGKNVFVTFLNNKTAVGLLDLRHDKFTVGSDSTVYSSDNVQSIRET